MGVFRKIVRQRLGAPGGTAAVGHPDANLLAGFLEQSLTAKERSLVLGHLAQCAGCREQVSRALPEAAMAPALAAAARRWPLWLRWPVLRWGLLVASLAIMGTVALVRPPPARRMELASRTRVPPPSTAPLPSDVTIGAVASKVAEPLRLRSQETASLEKKSAAKDLAKSSYQAQTKKEEKLLALAMPHVSQAQTPAPAPPNGFRTSPNATNGGRSNRPSTAVVAQAAPPQAAPLDVAAPQGESAQQASDSVVGSEAKSSEAARAPEEDKGKSVGGTVGGLAGGMVQTPPPKTSRKSIGNLGANPVVGQAITAKSKWGPAPATPSAGLSAEVSNPISADWSISASGKVQRSRDGRKTWEELDVDKSVVFRAVFAVGPDVWLGGTKGALYHSTDGGQHWTRVSITTGSTTVTDDVIRIAFKDAQHGTVRTSAGETWATSDGGQQWQRQ